MDQTRRNSENCRMISDEVKESNSSYRIYADGMGVLDGKLIYYQQLIHKAYGNEFIIVRVINGNEYLGILPSDIRKIKDKRDVTPLDEVLYGY